MGHNFVACLLFYSYCMPSGSYQSIDPAVAICFINLLLALTVWTLCVASLFPVYRAFDLKERCLQFWSGAA